MEIKRIDFSKGSFKANKKEYFFSDTLSVSRFEEFEKLQILFGYNLTYDDLFQNLTEVYQELNKTQFVKASVLVYNLLDATKRKAENKIHPALQICALFCNEKNEDRGKFDAEKNNEKIKNWRQEGYAMVDFFSLAANLVRGFVKNYSTDLEASLAEMKIQTEK